MTDIIKSPLTKLTEDDIIQVNLSYGVSISVCPKCLEEGNVFHSLGFYQDNCHICDTKMKPIRLTEDKKVVFGLP